MIPPSGSSWTIRNPDRTGPSATVRPPVSQARSFEASVPGAGLLSQIRPSNPESWPVKTALVLVFCASNTAVLLEEVHGAVARLEDIADSRAQWSRFHRSHPPRNQPACLASSAGRPLLPGPPAGGPAHSSAWPPPPPASGIPASAEPPPDPELPTRRPFRHCPHRRTGTRPRWCRLRRPQLRRAASGIGRGRRLREPQAATRAAATRKHGR